MFQEEFCHGAMAAAPDSNQPPDWLKTMLENQNKNNEQLQMMMAPLLIHITSGSQAPQTSRVQGPSYATTDQVAALSQKTASLTEQVEKISKSYVSTDQFNLLMQKMEQLQSKLDILTPREPRKLEEVNQEWRRGRSPTQDSTARTKTYSPSPNRAGAGLCYHCGEEGHFRRECVRLSTPPLNPSQTSKDQNHSTTSNGPERWRSQSPTPQVGRAKSRGPSLLIDVTEQHSNTSRCRHRS